MNLIYAYEETSTILPSIFLAGPSPRQVTDYNWRIEAIKILQKLGFNGNVFIPLPRDGIFKEYDDQVAWELEHLELADNIAFWIPRNLETLPGFTTNVEFGLYLKSNKIILGYPKNAEKMKYLHFLAKENYVPIFHTLNETLNQAMFDCVRQHYE